MRPVIIDTDPGIDDAFAILLALRSSELDVRGLTVVHGNCDVDQGTGNARKVLALAGRCDVPVARGADRPLLRDRLSAWEGHGPDGLGGAALAPCPTPPHALGAVRFLIETLLAAPEPMTLIPIGPLTNVALALAAAPEIKPHIAELVVMGGAVFCPGNRTPAAEFNVLADPEAAHIVVHAGVPLTLVGLDVTSGATLDPPHLRQLETAGDRIADFAARAARFVAPFALARYGGKEGAMQLHDPLAVAVAIDRSLVRTRAVALDVETATGLDFGRTIADANGLWGRPPNVQVCVDVDAERFIALVIERLCRR